MRGLRPVRGGIVPTKPRCLAVAALCALAVGLPACASTGNPALQGVEVERGVSEREAERGLGFLPLAKEFGYTRYGRASRDGETLRYDFLPEGESLRWWRHLGSVSLTQVGDTSEEGRQALPDHIAAVRAQAAVEHAAGSHTGPGGLVAFLHGESDGFDGREHRLAAIWQLVPGTLAEFRAAQREEFSPRQVEQFKLAAAQLVLVDTSLPRDFVEGLREAQRNLGTAEGLAYDKQAGGALAEPLEQAIEACRALQPDGEASRASRLLFKLDERGRPVASLLHPPTPIGDCVRRRVAAVAFPPPPRGDYWITVGLHFSRR